MSLEKGITLICGTQNNAINVEEGLTFISTGEYRLVKKGEYYLCLTCQAEKHMEHRGWVHVYKAEYDREQKADILRRSKN